MRRKIYYLLSVIVLLSAFACNDDFLKDNRKELTGEVTDGALILYSASHSFEEVIIEIPKLQNLDFKVLQYPQFIDFKSFDGKIDETGKISFEIRVGEYEAPIHLEPIPVGEIILNVKNFGLLDIPIFSLNYGIPRAGASQTLFDFGSTAEKNDFKLTNNAEGYLFCALVDKPSWLKLNVRYFDTPIEIGEELLVYPNSSESIELTPDIEGLEPGVYEDEFIIITSDELNPVLKFEVKITIPSYENPETMVDIEGKVVDAAFDKSTNTLIYITQSPSKLVTYQVESGDRAEIQLNKNPQRITLSADHKQILLAENEQIEIFELATLERVNKFEFPYIVSHLADGENGYIYFSNNNFELFSLNVSTGELKKQNILIDGYDNLFIAANELLKYNGKPLICLSNNDIGGFRLYLVDCSTPDELKYVNHWIVGIDKRTSLSEDQKYLFSTTSTVYRAPDENSDDHLYETAYLFSNDGLYINFEWIHHAQSNASIWGSYKYYNQSEYSYRGRILQFDDQTFDLKNSFESNKYAMTINGKKDYYDTVAHFVFTKNDGKQLILIKNVTETNINAWHLEFIDL